MRLLKDKMKKTKLRSFFKDKLMKKNNKYKKFNLSTLSIHAGQKKDKNYNYRAVPI